MSVTLKTAIDPLWQCLCPSWTQSAFRATITSFAITRKRPRQCLNESRRSRPNRRQWRAYTSMEGTATYKPLVRQSIMQQPLDLREQQGYGSDDSMLYTPRSPPSDRSSVRNSVHQHWPRFDPMVDLRNVPVNELYHMIHRLGNTGKVDRCRVVADFLISKRKEKPSLQLYTALIMSNISQHLGSAWQAADYLQEMQEAGIQADSAICHAILKVCSVHPDHLLRTDILHYMASRWYQLSEDGARDVVVSMLREGLFEQAMERLDAMSQAGKEVPAWLWDMAIYTLCHVREVEEATRILRQRVDSGEIHISRGVWNILLDEASMARYHAGVSLVWSHQVNTGYINPASGICLNVLSTAAHAGDAVLATDVFTHLSKRGTVFQAVHYEQLITCYLSAKAPDLKRAISILTIMATEKLEPTAVETRSLYIYLRDRPSQVNEALLHLRTLHQRGRRIPIAALNLLIESYIDQDNLDDAMKIYKLIHTFVPINASVQKSFANIDTFNFLLRGCRKDVDARLASFLVTELLALHITPTALTYDRLILVFLAAGSKLLHNAEDPPSVEAQEPDRRARGLELLDWSFRHFQDMQPMGWLPRFGTMEKLATELAAAGDERCWDVLQAGEDDAKNVEGWGGKGKWARRNVEAAWAKANEGEHHEDEDGLTANGTV